MASITEKRVRTRQAAMRDMPPGTPREWLPDEKQPGLRLQITRTGEPTWYCVRRVSGSVKFIRLGTFTELSVPDARKAAAVAAGQLADGKPVTAASPVSRRKVGASGHATLADCLERCESTIWHPSRVRQPGRSRAMLERHCKSIMDAPANAIGYDDALDLFHRISLSAGPVMANRVRSVLSIIWQEAAKRGAVAGDVWKLVDRLPEKPAKRRLSVEEMAAYWPVVNNRQDAMADAVKLILLTGLRKGNVHGMRKEWIDGDTLKIPGAAMKMNAPHELPLTQQAIKIIRRRGKLSGDSPWLFPQAKDPSKHIFDLGPHHRKMQDEIGITPLVKFHDLRRTAASWLGDLGASEAIIREVLAHQSTPTTTSRYVRLAPAVVREWLEKLPVAYEAAGGGK